MLSWLGLSVNVSELSELSQLSELSPSTTWSSWEGAAPSDCVVWWCCEL